MKTDISLINKTERLAGLLLIILIIARLLFGTELNVALRVSLTLLSIFYMWFGFFIFNRLVFADLLNSHKRKRVNSFRITTSILMGLCYSFSLIAIMFCFYFLKGMQFILGLSAFLLAASFVLMLFFNWFRPSQTSYFGQFYLRSLVLGVILSALMLTPIEKRLELLYNDHPDFVEAYLEYHKNPEQQQLVENLKEARCRFR